MKLMKYLVVDTETYYDDDFSVATMGPQAYCADPRFDCYMVSISDSEGLRWTGHPESAPWDKIYGPDVTLLSCNVGFDFAVLCRLAELKLAPEPEYAAWYDVSCLGAFLGSPRSLAGMAKTILGIEASKEARNKAKGKHFCDFTPEEQQEMIAYAQKDADLPLEIWNKCQHLWPEHERWLSVHSLIMGQRGLPVNSDKVNAAIASLTEQRDEALALLPWDYTGTPLSKKHMAKQCEIDGLKMPASMAKDSEECALWEDQYADTYPWIRAVRTYRRTNMLLTKFEAIRNRTAPDGFFKYDILYGGAHTMRWSGVGGFNCQNMSRDPMFGVNMRECFEAPPGYKMIITDLSQIEPRVLAYLAGDNALLDAVRAGFGIYEAYARANMGWTGGALKKENPKTYTLAKALVLGLGYGCGFEKFILVARILAGLDVMDLYSPEDEAPVWHAPRGEVGRWLEPAERVSKRLVDRFRATNPKLAARRRYDDPSSVDGFWATLENHMKRHAGTRQPCDFELPSGRVMRYLDVLGGDKMSAVTCKDGRMTRRSLWGSLLAENITQAGSRDVFAFHIRLIEEAGIPIHLTVHDEVVCLVREDQAEAALAKVLEIMHTAPPWMPGLPVAAEGKIVSCYEK